MRNFTYVLFAAVLIRSGHLLDYGEEESLTDYEDDQQDEYGEDDQLKNGTDSLIEEIRQWVAQNGEDFDPEDVDRLLHGPDWHVLRYIEWTADQEDQLDAIQELITQNLQWRSTMRINQLTAEDFPCEFWLAGFAHLTRDRQGSPVLLHDIRTFGLYTGGLSEAWYAFSYFQYDYVDRFLAAQNQTRQDHTWKIFYGLSGVTTENRADVTGMMSAWRRLADRFPAGIEGFYIQDLHPFIEPACRFFISLAPARSHDLVHIVRDRERFFTIKKRDMPTFLGGRLPPSRSLFALQFPGLLERCVPLERMASQKGWSEASVKDFLHTVKPHIDYNFADIFDEN